MANTLSVSLSGMREKGIPAVVLADTAFVELARTVAKAKGASDLPVVVVRAPIGGLSEEENRASIDAVIDAASIPMPKEQTKRNRA